MNKFIRLLLLIGYCNQINLAQSDPKSACCNVFRNNEQVRSNQTLNLYPARQKLNVSSN
jgi:hypothetical protein